MTARLSPQQLAALAEGAGFSMGTGYQGKGLVWAIAVALAESGGRPDAVNTNSDAYSSRDRGLWQINDHWHPEVSDAQAFDPAGCAAAAYRISHGGNNWSAWATFHNGAAQAQMGVATMAAISQARATPPAPVKGNPVGNVIGAIEAPAKAAISTAEAIGKAGAWVGNAHNWVRVIEVVGGVVAFFIGLELLAKSGVGGGVSQVAGLATAPAHVAAKGAKHVAEAGAAVAAA